MAGSFDPYFEWLGIHPDERPLQYYRLLGLLMYEEKAEAIEAGYARQSERVRKLATKDRAAKAQKLLTELAKAREVLLSPEKRAQYDRLIDQRMGASGPSQAATSQSTTSNGR